MKKVYQEFGLTESEISLIANATMKRDYFYTSPNGRRLFQLDLGKLTLSLVGSPDHALLDSLSANFDVGSNSCHHILTAKNINYKPLLDDYMPHIPQPILRQTKYQSAQNDTAATDAVNVIQTDIHETDKIQTKVFPKIAEFLDAVDALPERKTKDGAGRAAKAVADLYKVSPSTVYQARKVLKNGQPELIEALRNGDIPVKTAYKRLKKYRNETEV
jgi:hypothetical protein